ncbi:hypothetical protein O9929_11260 [Vibrio lentus]|nr:hypothetical protein [Vibrio lentus]
MDNSELLEAQATRAKNEVVTGRKMTITMTMSLSLFGLGWHNELVQFTANMESCNQHGVSNVSKE